MQASAARAPSARAPLAHRRMPSCPTPLGLLFKAPMSCHKEGHLWHISAGLRRAAAPFRAMLAPVLPRAAHSALRPVPHPRMPRPASSRYARGSGKCSPSSGPCIFLRSNCEARVGSVSCSGCTFMGASVSRPLAPPCVGAPARGNAQGPQLRCGDSRMWSAGGVAPDVPRVRACARGPMTTEGKERVWSTRFLAARSG